MWRLIVVVSIACVSACGTVREMSAVSSQVGPLEAALEPALGVRPSVYFNVVNGQLETLTVALDSEAVKDRPIGDLGAMVRQHVHAVPLNPHRIVLSIRAKQLRLEASHEGRASWRGSDPRATGATDIQLPPVEVVGPFAQNKIGVHSGAVRSSGMPKPVRKAAPKKAAKPRKPASDPNRRAHQMLAEMTAKHAREEPWKHDFTVTTVDTKTTTPPHGDPD